mmetsp:Transcript_4969/g.12829  ORF Transcript_4969/g.12829 Transcript_4969/m.12829 type:complete len:475 (+) Transcript_4969:158-1582(+)
MQIMQGSLSGAGRAGLKITLARWLDAQPLLRLALGLGLPQLVAQDELPHAHLRELVARDLHALAWRRQLLRLKGALDHVVHQQLHRRRHVGLHVGRQRAQLVLWQGREVLADRARHAALGALRPRLGHAELLPHALDAQLEIGDVLSRVNLQLAAPLEGDLERAGDARLCTRGRGRQPLLTRWARGHVGVAQHRLELGPRDLAVLVAVKRVHELAHFPAGDASRDEGAVDADGAASQSAEKELELRQVDEARPVLVDPVERSAQLGLAHRLQVEHAPEHQHVLCVSEQVTRHLQLVHQRGEALDASAKVDGELLGQRAEQRDSGALHGLDAQRRRRLEEVDDHGRRLLLGHQPIQLGRRARVARAHLAEPFAQLAHVLRAQQTALAEVLGQVVDRLLAPTRAGRCGGHAPPASHARRASAHGRPASAHGCSDRRAGGRTERAERTERLHRHEAEEERGAEPGGHPVRPPRRGEP